MDTATTPHTSAALLALMNAELLRAILAELPPEARRRCLERVGVLVEGMGLDDDEDAAAAHWFAGMLPESSRGAEG